MVLGKWTPGLLQLFAAFGCGLDPTRDAGLGTVEGLDTSAAGIAAFVNEGRYAGWTAEPAVHPSEGPHGQVRVFFSEAVLPTLRAGAEEHPLGSILVKELYDPGGVALGGHAVMVKARAGAGRETWVFFEGFGPDDRNPIYGRGLRTCTGCHDAGMDQVLVSAP